MLKHATPVSFDQHCLHLTFKPCFSSESYSHEYDDLPTYIIYVTHTITIRTPYDGYTRHTPNMLEVRYSEIIRIRYSYVCNGLSPIAQVKTLKVVRISRFFFSEICIRFLKFTHPILYLVQIDTPEATRF